ncbi:hypothetical protein CON53_28045 [Bacillus cereus]|nr:hypothetical protein CON53_28045 [Bacillus cereus]PFH88481.1 hypothetical protein COI81_13420 [Bacillus cereus]PFM56447.1 hypothetical protein COJ52_18335 [Bacillus cereus]PFS01090.1 hypothetical protein COK55_30885 [Bacillus cereus]PGS30009.1 hypothetical protein COC55_04270 [Bacillus cereus]
MQRVHIKLSLIQLFLLRLNLFIFSSAMPFLPWFIDNAFGWLGIVATTPFLLIIGRIMPQLKKSEEFCITRTRKAVPFIASIVSLCIMLLPTTELSIVIALTVNGLMAIITIVFLLQDFYRLNKKYKFIRFIS